MIRTASILFILICLGCGSKEKPLFRVIDFQGNNNQGIAVGDTLGSKEIEIYLAGQDMLLLDAIGEQIVYSLQGPQKVNTSNISKSKIKEFNSKYFSVIKENLDKNPQELRYAIMGGAARGPKLNFDIMDGSSLFNDQLQLSATSITDQACFVGVSLDEELLETDNEISMDLKSLRYQSEDRILVLTVDCGHEGSREIFTTLISNDKKETFKKTIATLKENNYPAIALTNFYLENKLFILAREEIKSQNGQSKLWKELDNILK